MVWVISTIMWFKINKCENAKLRKSTARSFGSSAHFEILMVSICSVKSTFISGNFPVHQPFRILKSFTVINNSEQECPDSRSETGPLPNWYKINFKLIKCFNKFHVIIRQWNQYWTKSTYCICNFHSFEVFENCCSNFSR